MLAKQYTIRKVIAAIVLSVLVGVSSSLPTLGGPWTQSAYAMNRASRSELPSHYNTDSAVQEQANTASSAQNRQVVVILVNGFGDCCMQYSSRLINGLESLDAAMSNIDIVFAGVDARGLSHTYFANYIVPWNSLYNKDQSEFGGNWNVRADIEDGTNNFIRETRDYLSKFPADTPVIMIGHSFGGDSILQYVEAISQNYVFVGVIDPIGFAGHRTPILLNVIGSKVGYFFNRWQENFIWPTELYPNYEIYERVERNVTLFNLHKIRLPGELLFCTAQRGCNQKSQDIWRHEDGSVQREELTVTSWVEECIIPELKDLVYPKDPAKCTVNKVVNTILGEAKILIHMDMPRDPFVQREILDALTKQLDLIPSLSGKIYVDAAHRGTETGSQDAPFLSIQSASYAAKDGAEISIRAGFYPEPLLLDRPVKVTAQEGKVYIGAQSQGLNLVGDPIISPFAPYQRVAPGDLDCNGTRNMVDAVLIHTVDWQDPPILPQCPPLPTTATFHPACDVNDDAQCNAMDATIIQNCDIGIGAVGPLCPLVGLGSEYVQQKVDVPPNNEPAVASVDIGSISLPAGEVGTVPIMITLDDLGAFATTVEVRYDPALIDIIDCSLDPDSHFDLEACNLEFVKDGGTQAIVRFNVASFSAVTGVIKLANLTVKAIGREETTASLDVEGVSVYGHLGLPLRVANQDGIVTITKSENPVPTDKQKLHLPLVER